MSTKTNALAIRRTVYAAVRTNVRAGTIHSVASVASIA